MDPRNYAGKVQAVIFDWAGTVIDCGVFAPVLTFMKSFEHVGVAITEAEARGPMGVHKKLHIQRILQDVDVHQRWVNRFGTGPTDADVQRIYETYLLFSDEIIVRNSKLIEGTTETVAYLKNKGIKIGSTTGYTTQILKALKPVAAALGYEPDCYVAADEVEYSRPDPGMVFLNAIRMNVYPMAAVVKVDDTPEGILEGVNAGCWTVGVALTGNEVGLSDEGIEQLDKDALESKVQKAREVLRRAGANYVVDSVKDLPAVIEDIEKKLLHH